MEKAFVTLNPGTLLAPVPAVMVSCARKGERPNIVTIAWAGTVNSDPPMCSVSVRKERFSHPMLTASREFTVTLPTAALAEKVDYCGVVSGRDVDKFAACGLTPEPAETVGAPLVAECPVNLECRVKQILELGSHDLFLADILAVRADERLIDEKGRLKLETADLLAYVHGHYHRVADAIGHFGFSIRRKPGAKTRVG